MYYDNYIKYGGYVLLGQVNKQRIIEEHRSK
jgi:hypothetical protein